MTERLQKIISASGLMSRRAAEEFISSGRVSVNGNTAALGDKADAESDNILVDGKALPPVNGKLYIMLNKPKGYVTTMSDELGRKTVTELMEGVPGRVFPVGRLDMNSEGLLLMTNDGEFANKMTHPSHNIEKVYRTWVQGSDIEAAAQRLRLPMELDGYLTAPAHVDIIDTNPFGAVLDIRIHEGRNRQVRRMCQQVGLRVTKLKRTAEGGLLLGNLGSGKWRSLTVAELNMLK